MTANVTVIRYNDRIKKTDEKIVDLLGRFENINLSDKSQWANTSFAFTRQLYNMLQFSAASSPRAQPSATSQEEPTTNPTSPNATTKTSSKPPKPPSPQTPTNQDSNTKPVDTTLIKPRPRNYAATSVVVPLSGTITQARFKDDRNLPGHLAS